MQYLEAAEQYRRAVARVQRTCRHPIKFLVTCRSDDHSPPMRVCTHCGLTEDGWGCGYIVLAPNRIVLDALVSREEATAIGRGLHITEAMKGGLIRKFRSVRDLINEHWLAEPPVP